MHELIFVVRTNCAVYHFIIEHGDVYGHEGIVAP